MRTHRDMSGRLGGERGTALAVAMSTLLVVGMLTAVAAQSSITGLSQSGRDAASRDALAAVEAGINTAIYRLNAVGPDPAACVVKDEATGILRTEAPAGPEWCATQSEELANGDGWLTRTSVGAVDSRECQTSQTRRIVAYGWDRSGRAPRRAIARIGTNTGTVFGRCAIISWQRFSSPGGTDNAYVRGNLATNGPAVFGNSFKLCGDVHAESLDLRSNAEHLCGTDYSPNDPPNPYRLRKVKEECAPGKEWSHPDCNNNDRIAIGGPDPLEPYNGNPANVDWDPAGRSLVLKKQSKLTLTGNVYSFCFLKLTDQSQLIVAPRDPGSTVRIFIDSPESCPGQPSNRTVFLKLGEWGTLHNTNPDPTSLQIYMIGTFDPGRRYGTRATITNKPQDVGGAGSEWFVQNFVLYAPRSRVALGNKTRLIGAVAAKRVTVKGTAKIIWSRDVTKLNGSNFSVVPTFILDSWAECPAPPLGAAPETFIEGCTG